MKKRILIITGRYLPGYKDGGPVRTIKNLVDYYGKDYEFRILTCDRDHQDKCSYPNILVNNWNTVGNAMVYYVPPNGFKFKLIKSLAEEVNIVYICGCYNDYAIKTMILKRLNIIKNPVFIASMGNFSPLVFKKKFIKKKAFITLCNVLGLFKNIFWSATSRLEVNDIKKQVWSKDEQFFIAEDLPRKNVIIESKKSKKKNSIKIVWISRIMYKKNLMTTIEILKNVKCNVTFSIYGPIEDIKYWENCLAELNKLPINVKWKYYGEADSEKVIEIFKLNDLFLFVTYGENYGHVIIEALSAGCQCLISDQTPWLDLEERKVGYVYKINEISKFVEAIEFYAKMDEENFNKYVKNSYHYASEIIKKNEKNSGYLKILNFEWKDRF